MKISRWLSWPVICISLMVGPVMAAEEPSPNERASEDAPVDGDALMPMDSEALDALNRMVGALAQAQGFSVTIRAGYDIVQNTGQKITFGERRRFTLSRPDRLRIEVEESDGKRTLVIYDGKAITVFNPGENVYGQIKKVGSVDDGLAGHRRHAPAAAIRDHLQE